MLAEKVEEGDKISHLETTGFRYVEPFIHMQDMDRTIQCDNQTID